MGAPIGNKNAAGPHKKRSGLYAFTERRKAYGKMYSYGWRKREKLAKKKKYKPFAGMSLYGKGYAIASGW